MPCYGSTASLIVLCMSQIWHRLGRHKDCTNATTGPSPPHSLTAILKALTFVPFSAESLLCLSGNLTTLEYSADLT